MAENTLLREPLWDKMKKIKKTLAAQKKKKQDAIDSLNNK